MLSSPCPMFISLLSFSPLLHCKLIIQYHFSGFCIYISIRIWYLSITFWFTSLYRIGSRFIHFIRTDSNAFHFMACLWPVFIGRTDAETETPILWPPNAKSWLIGKDRDAGKDWGQEEKGTTEDEMVGRHHQLNGHKFGRLRELVLDREAWHATAHGVTKSRTRLSNWTELKWTECLPSTVWNRNLF